MEDKKSVEGINNDKNKKKGKYFWSIESFIFLLNTTLKIEQIYNPITLPMT